MINITGNETELSVLKSILSEQYCPLINFEHSVEQEDCIYCGNEKITMNRDVTKFIGLEIEWKLRPPVK